MKLQEIKDAVNSGKIVHWENELYEVRKNKLGEFYIVCTSNGSSIGLTWLDGETLNGEESTFYESPTYTIIQSVTGEEIWTGSAVDEHDAFERCARAAGYKSHSDMIDAIGDDDGVAIHEVGE